jgi:hypothetical protein
MMDWRKSARRQGSGTPVRSLLEQFRQNNGLIQTLLSPQLLLGGRQNANPLVGLRAFSASPLSFLGKTSMVFNPVAREDKGKGGREDVIRR